MKRIDLTTLSPGAAYNFLIGAIVPRPIAFVSTIDPSGVPNVAPFSFFTGVTSRPPTVLFCVNRRAGEKKDTQWNIDAIPECVINVVDEALAERMNIASGDWPPGDSEFARAGLTALESECVRPPRVAESRIHMECAVRQVIEVGTTPFETGICIAEILVAHVSEAVLDERGYIDSARLQAIGRMSRHDYTRTRDVFEMIRPVVERG
jgi:flavin reductase (DIM6/NTAB) family NADH-FMN oxidoreductase RutF